MKKLFRYKIKTSLFLALAAASVYSGVSLAQDVDAAAPAERMTYRENDVYLVIKSPGYAILGGTYQSSDRAITSGQDPNGKNDPPQSYDVAGHDGKIAFSVGRKGSEEVARWFSSYAGGNKNTFGKNPDKLNFGFHGKLTLSLEGDGIKSDIPVILPAILLGQGHAGAANNWWFGGSYCTKVSDKQQVKCESSNYPSMVFTFERGRTFWGGPAPDEVWLYVSKK